MLKKEFDEEDIIKLESLLRIKPTLKVPAFPEELFYSTIEKYETYKKDKIILYSYLKVAATVFIIFTTSFLYIKYDLLKKVENFRVQHLSEIQKPTDQSEVIGIIVFVKGRVEIKDEKNNTTSLAYIGNTINENSVITTNSKSFIEVLLEKRIQIRINPDTSIKLTRRNDVWKILQSQGETFHYVKTLTKKEEYYVETPTTIAGVRGTFFKVKTSKDIHEIVVERGKVNVYLKEIHSNTNQIKNLGVINQNTIFIFDEKNQIYEKKDTKNSELSVIFDDMNDHIKIVENETLWEEIKKIPNVVNKNDIEKVYNRRLEIISLKDGRKLQGVVAAQIDEKIILHTTEGIIIININDINYITYTENEQKQ